MVVKNGAESHGWKLKEHLKQTKRKETIYWDLPSSRVEREGLGWDSWAFRGGW